MKRFLLVLFTLSGSVRAQDPPAPAAQQQPPSPSPQDIQRQQQSEQARRAADEAAMRQQEAERRRFLDSIKSPTPDTRLTTPTEGCVAAAGPADREFDIQSIPLSEWLTKKDITQIPWKVRVERPSLRMDQRYELAYTARIRAKDLSGFKAGNEFVFVSGVSTPDGQWLTTPKVRREHIQNGFSSDFNIEYSECVFLRPGNYILWLAFYYPETRSHNLITREVHVTEERNVPLPMLHTTLPAAEFPQATRTSTTVRVPPGRLFLPVRNKRPMSLELLSVVSPPEQWLGRPDILENHNNAVLAAVSVLSQMELTAGSVSAAAVDVVKRTAPFEQGDARSLNWSGMVQSLTTTAASNVVSTQALESSKERGVFFKEFIQQRLNNAGESTRIVIVVSSSMMFERGSDLEALQPPVGCNCRFYHVRFRHNRADLFDDLEKVLKRMRPRIFNVTSPREFRRALSVIIRDLEASEALPASSK